MQAQESLKHAAVTSAYPPLTDEELNLRRNGLRPFRGTYFFENGVYVGEFLGPNLHGFGTYFYTSGNIYSGQFKNNKISGIGRYFYRENGNTYIGEFKDGMLHGKGTLYRKDGDSLEGTWVDDKKHGKMILRKARPSKSWDKILSRLDDPTNDDVLNDKQYIIEQVWEHGVKKSETRSVVKVSRYETSIPPVEQIEFMIPPIREDDDIEEENKRLKEDIEDAYAQICALNDKYNRIVSGGSTEKALQQQKQQEDAERVKAEGPSIMVYFRKGKPDQRICSVPLARLTNNLYEDLRKEIRSRFGWATMESAGIKMLMFYMTADNQLIEITKQHKSLVDIKDALYIISMRKFPNDEIM